MFSQRKFSTFLVPTLLVLFAMPSLTWAQGPPKPVEVVNDSFKPYRFVGFTIAPLAASVGHQAMHEACQAAMNNPKARLATSKEIIETPNLPPFETPNSVAVPAAWVQPVIVSILPGDPPTFYELSGYSGSGGQGALSCRAWTTTAVGFGALLWVPPGKFGSGQCQFARFAACSAPEPE
jgi:hypothetical protein